jgi:D-aminoacyl-tRNA deacylase
MKVVIQRVNYASVKVSGETVGEISRGVCLLVGFGPEDDASKLKPMAEKIVNMRIFPNEEGRFDRSTLEIGGAVLAVPQFTLYADTRKGRRPDFFGALEPAAASRLFDEFVALLGKTGAAKVAAGVFGGDMKVALENDGPVTIVVEG